MHGDRLYVSLSCFVNSKVRGKREKISVKRPQEIASCHARGWAHFATCYDIFLDPGNPPEHLSNIRRNLQGQGQWHYFTSLGWPQHKDLRGSRGCWFGAQECALKRGSVYFLTQM